MSPNLELYFSDKRSKYGMNDFQKFDDQDATHASIGYGTIGKVNIDCRFLIGKSQWGRLKERNTPAGVIYLDLTFDQPKDCLLHSAIVKISLDDQSPPPPQLRGVADSRSKHVQSRLQMGDSYGPEQLAGPEKSVDKMSIIHLTPSAQFAGAGIGGLGIDKQSSRTYTSRWRFTGVLVPGASGGVYKGLKWELSENDLDVQICHKNTIHTAFTLEHSCRSFYLQVEIDGRLRDISDRLKKKFAMFPPYRNDQENIARTYVNLGDTVRFHEPLDALAKQLREEMNDANKDCDESESRVPPGNINPSFVTRHESNPYIAPPSLDALMYATPESSVGPTEEPILHNLAQSFTKLQPRDRRPNVGQGEVCLHLATKPSQERDGLVEKIESGTTLDQPIPEEVLQILRIPALLFLLKMVASILSIFDQGAPVVRASVKDKDRNRPVEKPYGTN